ncbi:bifunctional adenosylcobinamide kinase/adenosylcobinamide-phosphate guanylyltransferase [Thalassotalea castellviae]|uniref:Bifunctional adenosylcobalamin biosynthesis protein n=1 Tax=Thalassotalea castellviae TaxID=3075612 RepID=A0ABU2ZYQ8_9GAMM|nr:bifunctional adenosylcobinamide kinase/adenosylcobinamide-phosphate guanylyltransferase [Thalassotalea sp. W431]MDT0603056.1 bifunctional adenosylcobinamide kinase/adenosylcobinamide-phosphate guanylyltransferase [Thalassotalea sp. W431]
MLHLVLGGARSGKSSFSEQWIQAQRGKEQQLPIYVATAQALDEEMQQRIIHHQQQRIAFEWQLIECPLHLTDLLVELDNKQLALSDEPRFVLVDCLTLWLSNHLMVALEQSQDDNPITDYLTNKITELIDVLTEHSATIMLVANEVGLGVVPLGKPSRLFVDHAGWLNQQLAKVAEQVTLVTAGIPLTLKSSKNAKVNYSG